MVDREIEAAAEVCAYLLELSMTHQKRFDTACMHEMPFGDAAYGKALLHWRSQGCPKSSFFSYAEGQTLCPALMEFRKELTEKFGLPILTVEEAKARKPTASMKVTDWGKN